MSSCEQTFNVRFLELVNHCKRSTILSIVSRSMVLFSDYNPADCAGWCGIYHLWRSPEGNIRNSFLVKMVPRALHAWKALEIDSTEHGYQTHHAEPPGRYSLCVDLHKLCPHALLPEW